MQADTLSLTFAALADPTRRAILKRLGAGARKVEGAVTAIRQERPGGVQASARGGASRVDPTRSRSAVATVPARARAAQAGRRVGRSVSSVLGRELRSSRRVLAGAARAAPEGGARCAPQEALASSSMTARSRSHAR